MGRCGNTPWLVPGAGEQNNKGMSPRGRKTIRGDPGSEDNKELDQPSSERGGGKDEGRGADGEERGDGRKGNERWWGWMLRGFARDEGEGGGIGHAGTTIGVISHQLADQPPISASLPSRTPSHPGSSHQPPPVRAQGTPRPLLHN